MNCIRGLLSLLLSPSTFFPSVFRSAFDLISSSSILSCRPSSDLASNHSLSSTCLLSPTHLSPSSPVFIDFNKKKIQYFQSLPSLFLCKKKKDSSGLKGSRRIQGREPRMPFCNVSKTQNGDGNEEQHLNGIKIFYRRYGHGSTKVLLIIGLAGTHDSWGPQIMGLTGTEIPNDSDESKIIDREMNDDPEIRNGEEDGDEGIEICAFDNRGVGRSSIPTKKSEYTTTIMATDAIALMDHLGWKKAHVFGHSMGGMIACKLAALVPQRILSLALLNATGGGFECFPKLDRQTLSVAVRFLKAKTPEQRAAVDLDTHYTKEYLDECVGTNTRRSILYQQYVKGISSTGMQSNHGFEGQLNACWTHKLTSNEFDTIRSAGFLISIIHGRYDIIAQIYYARRLAEKLQPSARMIDLHGGHLVSHERPTEVNMALLELINASELKWVPEDWSNLSKTDNDSQLIGLQIGLSRRYTEGGSRLSFMFEMLAKLHLCLLYLFGLFVMVFEYGRRLFRGLKPARVGISTS